MTIVFNRETTHKMIIGNIEVTLQERRFENRRQYQAKTRVHGAFNTLSPELDVPVSKWVTLDAYRKARRRRIKATTARLSDVFMLLTFSDRELTAKRVQDVYVLNKVLRWNGGNPVDIYLSRVN